MNHLRLSVSLDQEQLLYREANENFSLTCSATLRFLMLRREVRKSRKMKV